MKHIALVLAPKWQLAYLAFGLALIAWNISIELRTATPRPWMEPEVLVEVIGGEPLVSFTGTINRPTVGAVWAAKIEADGVPIEICQGRDTADYQLDEKRPYRKTLQWWTGSDQCNRRLQPGVRYRLITSWCNAQGECHEATAVWWQPEK